MDCVLQFHQDVMTKYRPVTRKLTIKPSSDGKGRLTTLVIYYPFSPFSNILAIAFELVMDSDFGRHRVLPKQHEHID